MSSKEDPHLLVRMWAKGELLGNTAPADRAALRRLVEAYDALKEIFNDLTEDNEAHRVKLTQINKETIALLAEAESEVRKLKRVLVPLEALKKYAVAFDTNDLTANWNLVGQDISKVFELLKEEADEV